MQSFKFVIMILFVIGLIIVVRELTLRTMTCPTTNTEYNWVPRTLDMDVNDNNKITSMFSDIFQNATPWVGVPQNVYTEKQEVNFNDIINTSQPEE